MRVAVAYIFFYLDWRIIGGLIMCKLNYEQQKTLAVYETFFDQQYIVNCNNDQHTNEHVTTQKMVYLLQVAGIPIGDYDFSWNFKGPFSPGLLANLREIDSNADEVEIFYAENHQNPILSKELKKEILNIREMLELEKYKSCLLRWVELLGSLLYLSRSMLPGANYELVNQRLVAYKSDYCDFDENRRAWEALQAANLL